MPIPPALRTVLEAVAGVGRPLLVGGCVRDWLAGLEPKDFDIEVYGLSWEGLEAVLRPFGPVQMVGRSFGVMKLKLGHEYHDFSLPRRESKLGRGHRGFQIEADPDLSEAEAAARRDFTINALMVEPLNGRIIDHFAGQEDLQNGILRHTGPAFAEDPLRVLRGFQLAGRFALTMAPETVRLCRSIVEDYRTLPVERVWAEWEKWAVQSTRPSCGLDVLRATGWIVHFPEIAALEGVPQDPEWHPEGDVLTHTTHCLDALMRAPHWRHTHPFHRRIQALAVLVHDCGKAATTARGERQGRIRWVSPRHDAVGGPLAAQFLERIGAPRVLVETIPPLVEQHLFHLSWTGDGPSPSSIRRLARRLAPATIEQLCRVMEADSRGRPPLDPAETEERIRVLARASEQMQLEEQGPRPLLKGRHLMALGMQPGTTFGPILKEAFEAQLDGAFEDTQGALEWARNHPKTP
jgi:tRNA nucleotidyltransferase (CCA-adding enzyme)